MFSTNSYRKDSQMSGHFSDPLTKQDIIEDPESKIKYRKGNKIGAGGFGEVYEFIQIDNNVKRAAKIIPNSSIDKDPLSNIAYNNENNFNTILDFKYLCKCYSTFKDNKNAYFILDYQPNKTLNELIEKRQLSEIEIKHYCLELLLAIEYLHERNIIHRDIKLSNVLLSERMEVRLCDFGLAIENGIEGQKNKCGTPNYIAPELLDHKNGYNYSFEIDIWAFGVIIYTLYYHKTPFEHGGKSKTKNNILTIDYSFPPEITISKEAKELIKSILVKNPHQRPKIEQIKASPFFKNGKGIPKYLPVSTLNRAMSPEEEENYVIKAINDGECLDKDINLPNKDKKIYRQYYNKETNEQSENSDDDESDSSSKEGDENSSSNSNSNNEEKSKKKNGIINNNDNNNNNNSFNEEKNLKQNNINFNGNKGAFKLTNNIADKSGSSNSREDIPHKINNRQASTKRDLSVNENNSKSYGKMSETARFISNNVSGSDFFNSPAFKLKDREDSSKIVKDDMKFNDNISIDTNKIDNNLKYKTKNRYRSQDKNYSINYINDTFRNQKNGNNIINLNNKNNNENNNDSEFLIFNSLTIKGINDVTVNKYIDLSNKCGIGYILTNGDVGACFNDGTKMIRIKSTLNIVYIDEKGKQTLNNMRKKIGNPDYETKVKALLLFNKTFIKKSKNKSAFELDPHNHKNFIDLYVKKWIKSRHAFFFLLSNEKVQVLFDDKTQVIFDFPNKKVIYVNKNKQITEKSISQMKSNDEEMNKRVKYAKKILAKV